MIPIWRAMTKAQTKMTFETKHPEYLQKEQVPNQARLLIIDDCRSILFDLSTKSTGMFDREACQEHWQTFQSRNVEI